MNYLTLLAMQQPLNSPALWAQPKPAAAVAHGYAAQGVALMRGYTV